MDPGARGAQIWPHETRHRNLGQGGRSIQPPYIQPAPDAYSPRRPRRPRAQKMAPRDPASQKSSLNRRPTRAPAAQWPAGAGVAKIQPEQAARARAGGPVIAAASHAHAARALPERLARARADGPVTTAAPYASTTVRSWHCRPALAPAVQRQLRPRTRRSTVLKLLGGLGRIERRPRAPSRLP
ncbi:hypothetical protein T492DRAFT_104068 [Pavlovales sp. CCMP2436]|nr:hypothetical protein T492DRAFT_104068 [Pavlovales sp. CCMP2436]